MSILIVCSECGGRLRAPDSAVGRTASCPKCKAVLKIEPPVRGVGRSSRASFLIRNHVAIMTCVAGAIIGFLCGILVGREWLKNEIRNTFQTAFDDVATNNDSIFGSNLRRAPASKISGNGEDDANLETRLSVLKSAVYHRDSDFMSELHIELHVRNDTGRPISRAYFHAVAVSPGRSIPWVEDDFNYEIPGGLEPRESAAWTLVPNMFGEWSNLPRDRNDIQLRVDVVRLNDANGATMVRK